MKYLAVFLYFFLKNRFVSSVLEKVLEKWQVQDTFPENSLDAIAVISYAAHSMGLTTGSVVTSARGVYLAELHRSIIGWGIFKGPTQEIERFEKEKIFGSVTNVCVGEVTSSTDECEAILEAWQKTGRKIERVGVEAEGSHARRDKLVWQYYLPKYFPNAKLFFSSADARDCADKRNPMHLQRYWQVWLLFNICFYPLYRWFPGVAWFAKRNFHQATN